MRLLFSVGTVRAFHAFHAIMCAVPERGCIVGAVLKDAARRRYA
jgi:hypothetical protein